MTTPLKSGEIAHHAQNGLLLGTHDMGGANEFGGATEFGARAGRRDLGLRLAAPNQRPCVGLNAGAGLDRHRFAGEHGLIEQNFAAGELHIRRDHAHPATASPDRPAPARWRARSSTPRRV